MYARVSRSSITPKKPLRAQFQMLFSVRSGRLLMAEMDWFVGWSAAAEV